MGLNTVLDVVGLTKQYDGTRAVNDISFSVEAGQIVGLVGPNGAGKTTTISIITGLTEPDSGSVAIGDSSDRMIARSRLGFAPQSTGTYPALSVVENLEFFAAINGVARAKVAGRVEWALEAFALTELANRRLGTMSGGERRRVHLAAAMLHSPSLLLLDEPSLGIDPIGRTALHDLLRLFAGEGAAILLTSNDLAEVELVSEGVIVIDRGEIVVRGSVREVIGAHGQSAVELLFADGTREVVSLGDVSEDLPALLAQLGDNGRQLASIDLIRPSLESVFLSLTGARYDSESTDAS